MSSTQNRSQLAPGRQPLGSALFCDRVGFTPLTERHDPETVERVQRDYFGLMRAIVEEHGGGVEEGSMNSGDAVIALFDVIFGSQLWRFYRPRLRGRTPVSEDLSAS